MLLRPLLLALVLLVPLALSAGEAAADPNERVYFRDPYGQIRSMPQEAFIKHVVAVHKPQVMPG